MFFGYPLAATEGNWVHECLIQVLTQVHDELDAGEQPTPWPDILPEAHRVTLRRRTGLRDRLEAYRTAVASIGQLERQQVFICLTQQNRISELCDCSQDCELVEHLPESCRAPVVQLFTFAFRLLAELQVRDKQYKRIFGELPYRVCPFCGSEYFDAPGAPREDLDHYLSKSQYPFAAVNLRNLVPMGMRCNERYKLAQDILRDGQGNRRRAFDPYSERTIGICLSESLPFDGEDGVTPRWSVRFLPESDECGTWDSVFDIRRRITRDVLNVSFKNWLDGFRSWVLATGEISEDPVWIVDAIARYANHQGDLGYDDRAFLRAAVFRMFRDHCAAGNDRLIQLMRDLIAM